MLRTAHTRKRIAVGIALAAAVAVPVVPSALAGSGPLDGSAPDTRDFAALAHSPVVTVVGSPAYDWGDFAIGVAAALGTEIGRAHV